MTKKQEIQEENVETKELEKVEVPEGAEEISNEEAFDVAVEEVNKLREENTAIKQELDKKNAEIKEISEKAQTDAEEAAKKIAELEEKVKAFEENKETPSDNAFYIELLDQFDAKINEYAGLRRERLRKEFITDLKEEFQRQKEQLKNA